MGCFNIVIIEKKKTIQKECDLHQRESCIAQKYTTF